MSEPFPRKAKINIEISEGDSLELSWDEGSSVVTVAVGRDGTPVRPRSVDLSIYYDGIGRRKLVAEVQSHEGRGFSLSAEETVRRYSQVWAIDTSYATEFGKTFCVAAICALDPAGSGRVERVGGHLFGKVEGNPERYGWRRWLQYLLRSTDETRRYAIIVDSEQSLIKEMNDGTLAIHGGFMLPDNFDMIYATADKSDTILNHAIKAADRLSKEMRESFQEVANCKHFEDLDDEEAHVPVFIFCSESARAG